MKRRKSLPARISDAAASCGPLVFRAYVITIAVIAFPIMIVLGIGRLSVAAYEEARDEVMPDVRELASAFLRCIKTGKQA